MIINLTNHPSARWEEAQKKAAEKLSLGGQIVDHPFPQIDPRMTEEDLWTLAERAADKFLYETNDVDGIVVQGEFGFTFLLVYFLRGVIPCYYACSERVVTESTDSEGKTQKTSVFSFVQFREY
jgi:hypothetical protein